MNLLHLSDLHLRNGWHEEQGVILQAFFTDLERVLSNDDVNYLIFSGDAVQAGADADLFELFMTTFDARLNNLGIKRSNRILVPGNHDVSRKFVEANVNILYGLATAKDEESEFNNRVYNEYKDVLIQKFAHYLRFEEQFAAFGLGVDSFCGRGHTLSSNIGLYTLNSALFAFGGAQVSQNGHLAPVIDRHLLRIETRRLHQWLQYTDFTYRILVLHHPITDLAPWAQEQLRGVIARHFNIVFSGHVHDPDAQFVDSGAGGVIHCIAPPLFTRKSAVNLGYTIVSLSPDLSRTTIRFRQKSRSNAFVSGSFFTGTDDGRLFFSRRPRKDEESCSVASDQQTLQILEANFVQATTCTPSIGPLWVVPDLSDRPETDRTVEAIVHGADEIRYDDQHTIIFAPRQFGHTALGHFLAYDAWQKESGALFLLCCADEIPNHETGVKRALDDKLTRLCSSADRIRVIIVDDYRPHDKLHQRKLRSLQSAFPGMRFLLLVKLDERRQLLSSADELPLESVRKLYLWALRREHIRSLAQQYVTAVGSRITVSTLVDKVTSDLEKLNLYRTPLNCITLFIIAENQNELSPVNRTEMIERFLFLLFTNSFELPGFGTVSDRKDSIYALSALAEYLIRRGDIYFNKTEFFEVLGIYCREKYVYLEIDVLFQCLARERIIIETGGLYRFRFLYWLYFFAAHRMHHDESFASFILTDRHYIRFPEIIEFYSGIDRRRKDLLEILRRDLSLLNQQFYERSKIHLEFNPYRLMQWQITDEAVENIWEEIEEEARGSGLPTVIKDQIADKTFDRARPYTQELATFVNDSSMGEACRVMAAASSALRNSDHVNGPIKLELLKEIMCTWTKIVQLAVIISPLLADNGFVSIDRVLFDATSYRKCKDTVKRIGMIIRDTPEAVFWTPEKDFRSPRMAPLFAQCMELDVNEISKLMLVYEMILSKPVGWDARLKRYLLSQPKDSFFLLNTTWALRRELRYGFNSDVEKNRLMHLLGTGMAHHITGSKNPKAKLIEKAAKWALKERG